MIKINKLTSKPGQWRRRPSCKRRWRHIRTSTHKSTSYQKILKRVKNITRDGYTRKKVPENLDAIVIGSGIGGLTCAALLSKVGKKVLVLEQHYIAGGCTHTFEDKGYEFDT